jgi:hypothetical protein
MTRGRRASRRGVVWVTARLALTTQFALLLGLAAALPSRRAEAYVRYMTDSGIGFFWPQTWVPLTAYPDTLRDVNGGMEMTPEQILVAATAGAAAWSAGANACTFLVINVGSSTAAAPTAARYDYKNSLIFHTSAWSYDPDALAITSVFVNKKDGRIRDGDIEVNAQNFNWTDLDLVPDPKLDGRQDLQNALTHEMGHFIGLDHTCFITGTPPLDNLGTPVPDCNTAPPDVRATTMFASAIPGDTEKRTLAPDDIQAVCDIYPVAKDPMIYSTAQDQPACACALEDGAASGRGAGTWLPILGVALALGRRRGRARSG